MSADLAARLLAAVEETERIANAATGGAWTAYRNRGVFAGVLDRDWVAGTDPADATHIARHDPAAVLRRCASDRKILALHEPVTGFSGQQCTVCVGCWATEEGEDWPCETLRLLADGYGLDDGSSVR